MEAKKNREGYGSYPLQLGNSTVNNLSLISAKPTGMPSPLRPQRVALALTWAGTAGATMDIFGHWRWEYSYHC